MAETNHKNQTTPYSKIHHDEFEGLSHFEEKKSFIAYESFPGEVIEFEAYETQTSNYKLNLMNYSK